MVTPLWTLDSLLVHTLPLFRPEVWRPLTTPGWSTYSSYWAPYLIGSALFNVVFIVWTTVLVILFLQCSRRVPLLVSWYLVARAVVALLDLYFVLGLSKDVPGMMRAEPAAVRALLQVLLAGAIWIPYFWRSVRVRNTFTR